MTRSVAIIGAGMAGLAAARSLTAAGIAVTIYEKSRGVGGRVATRRIEGCVVDHGAQNLKPTGSALADVMLNELPTDDLVAITAPTRLYTNDGTIWPVDPERESEPKYTYRNGLTMLPKMLAERLPAEQTTFRYQTRIHRLEEQTETQEKQIILRGAEGEELGRADFVVLTAPAPQAADLLAESALQLRDTQQTLERVRALRMVEYTHCLSVLLGYAPPVPPAPAYALLAEDRGTPLLWLAFEQTKAPERAPNGEAVLIAQLGPLFSSLCYGELDEIIIGRTLNELRPLFGKVYEEPVWAQVKRWKYSQPRGTIRFEEVNAAEHESPIIVCGDALRPENGRIHQAYASGLEAAEAIKARW